MNPTSSDFTHHSPQTSSTIDETFTQNDRLGSRFLTLDSTTVTGLSIDDTPKHNVLSTETTIVLFSLGNLTLIITAIGIGFNILSMKAFKLMNKSVIYTYFQQILNCDTVRLFFNGLAAFLMQVFGEHSLPVATEREIEVPGIGMLIVTLFVLACSCVSSILEYFVNVDRVIAMTLYSNRTRPKTGLTQHPNIICVVCICFVAVVFVGRVVTRFVYLPLYNPLTTFIVFFSVDNEVFHPVCASRSACIYDSSQ